MFNESQTRRIAQRATIALVKAIDAFPELLAESEVEHAASVIADIIKTQLARPQPMPDPGDALARAIRAATLSAEHEAELQHAVESQP